MKIISLKEALKLEGEEFLSLLFVFIDAFN